MSRSSNDSAYGSWGRRKSIFALSPLTPTTTTDQDAAGKSRSTLKKHRRLPSQVANLDHPDFPRVNDDTKSAPLPSNSPTKPPRPSLSMRSSTKRPPSSLFGSLRSSMRSSTDASDYPGEPLTATSSRTPSLNFDDATTDAPMAPKMERCLMHGEVQTSAGMFRKKKEYLVLTETAITRHKSQAKASEMFTSIPNTLGRSPSAKHGQMPSVGSSSDLQTMSDSSGDKGGRVFLHQVVAVYRLEDGKPYFAIEICYLDEESSQASAMTLQFGNPEERDAWLSNVRGAVNDARLRHGHAISPTNLENAARIIERDNDYDPSNCVIFKVVQRQSAGKSSGRSPSDDLAKVASTVCFLAIGVHKIHLIHLVKPVTRSSSPSLLPNASQASYGILTVTAVKANAFDDTFELTFRRPLQRARHLILASSASYEITARLHNSENFLRPDCGSHLYSFNVPEEVEDILAPPVVPDVEEHNCFQRTLIAYCIAYGVAPTNVRYAINYHCEDAPRFELLPPADTRRPDYSPLDLLAIMRAVRYNETFVSISFANIPLDCLNGLHDNYGKEQVCTHTKHGTPIRLTADELGRSCLLVQEVRAMAASSKRLRRMDFTGCITNKPPPPIDLSEEESFRVKDKGCGIVEALFPLCRYQTTNVDWICLNGIYLSETDLDYLVGAAVEKSCHFRAIELNRCGLTDRSLGMILDALRSQDNTLEAIEIAGNAARIDPVSFDSQLGVFGFIMKLDLSNVSRTSGPEPLLQVETLSTWRLSELRLSGTSLNTATVDAIATYLSHPQSDSLHELHIDNTYLTGADVATLLESMARPANRHRSLHLDISQSLITKGLDQLTQAISNSTAPSHITMRAIEYREEAAFRKMLTALTVNKSIQYLDMSHTALPGDASEETCRALEKLFAENDTLIELNISGEDSRLATSKFGPGLNDALLGLKHNRSLQVFRVEKQKLGIQGASALAEVIRENYTLRELYCDNNEIPLQGLTDLVNSLIDNTSIVHLPTMEDGRAAAFRSVELTMKVMSELESPVSTRPPPPVKPSPLGAPMGVRRGLASVRRSAQRTATSYTPSFPALPSYSRTPSSPENSRNPTPITATSSRTKQSTGTSMAAPVSFTVQDIQTTHRLLTEQWDRQCYRLAQYLDRNWCMLHEIPTDMEVEDEKFERPGSVGSISKLLEQVKYDTTPRVEKDLYFDSHTGSTSPPPVQQRRVSSATTDGKQAPGFKQFVLDSGPTSPDSEVEEADLLPQLKALRVDTNLDRVKESLTPTQRGYTA